MTDTSFEDFMAQYDPRVAALAAQARQLILGTIPGILEMVDPPSKIVAYGFSSKYAGLVCAIAPYKSYINLIFSQGASLPNPDNLLTGTGKRARHVKITGSADLHHPGVKTLLTEAANRIQK